jgi:hypothetical protein
MNEFQRFFFVDTLCWTLRPQGYHLPINLCFDSGMGGES